MHVSHSPATTFRTYVKRAIHAHTSTSTSTSVSARAAVRSGNPDWLPDSAGLVAGSPRTWKVRP
eukprot:6306412-Prymnesium_polylepis.1